MQSGQKGMSLEPEDPMADICETVRSSERTQAITQLLFGPLTLETLGFA